MGLKRGLISKHTESMREARNNMGTGAPNGSQTQSDDQREGRGQPILWPPLQPLDVRRMRLCSTGSANTELVERERGKRRQGSVNYDSKEGIRQYAPIAGIKEALRLDIAHYNEIPMGGGHGVQWRHNLFVHRELNLHNRLVSARRESVLGSRDVRSVLPTR